MKERQ